MAMEYERESRKEISKTVITQENKTRRTQVRVRKSIEIQDKRAMEYERQSIEYLPTFLDAFYVVPRTMPQC